GQPAVRAVVVHLHDAGVLHLRDRLRLRQEARAIVRGGVPARQDHLQRARAAQAQLPGLVDDAHAAAAQNAPDLVAGDRLRAHRAPAEPSSRGRPEAAWSARARTTAGVTGPWDDS